MNKIILDRHIPILSRMAELDELHRQYVLGEISMDVDDPRTYEYIGLSETEALYVMGQINGFCKECGLECRCDEEYEAYKDSL